MEINKQELQQALTVVKPGLANKNTAVDQGSSFAFQGGYVVTYNDEISIRCPVEGFDITGALHAEDLYALLGKLKGDKLELEIKGPELLVTSGKSKAGMILEQEIKMPIDEVPEVGDWVDLPESFSTWLRFVAETCRKDLSQPIINCVHFAENRLEATDSFRVALVNLGEDMGDFLLSASSSMRVSEFQPIRMTYKADSGWVHFQASNDAILSCRVNEDTYPKIEHFFDRKGEEFSLPKNIKELVDRAEVFSRRDTMYEESMEITVEDNWLKVRSQNEYGWYEEKARVRYSGEPLNFLITPGLLRNIWKVGQTCIVDKQAVLFYGDHWKYVSMLREKPSKDETTK